MTTGVKSVDLCVVNYNSKDHLKRFIKTLNSDLGELKPWKLYIADNGSEDGSREYLEEAFTPENVVFNENIGYARAANQLARMGMSEVIGILNADIWMSTSDVFSIIKSFQDPRVHIMGPKQRDEGGRIRHAGITGTNTKPMHRGWNAEDPMDLQYRDFKSMVTVSGSAYFVRRDVWGALTNDPDYQHMLKTFVDMGLLTKDRLDYTGPFLPTRHYYEETWCSYFARHRGYGLYYDGRVSIGHTWHGSHEKGSTVDKLWGESQALFRAACDYFKIEHD